MTTHTHTLNPLNTDQIESAEKLISTLSAEQLQWFSGYLTGITKAHSQLIELIGQNGVLENTVTTAESGAESSPGSLKILYGTHSGNSKEVALLAYNEAIAQGISAEVIDVNDYNPRNLKKEKNIIVIISTHGEGEPPLEAEAFYNFLMSKKATQLPDTTFGVVALGDSSYKQFCKVGIDIEKRLSELGAKKIYNTVKCDLDFEESAEEWIKHVLPLFKEQVPQASSQKVTVGNAVKTGNDTQQFTKKHPYNAAILDRILLNGKGSAKETYHIELSLEDSGIQYKPGDSLGVCSRNDEQLVDKILSTLSFSESEKTIVNKEEKSLRSALIENYELTLLTPVVVEKYANLTNNTKLLSLLNTPALIDDYLYGRDILDLLNEYPEAINTEQFLSVLRKLPSRLYSIASSQEAYPDEVHLTVGAVKYSKNNRFYEGVCSNFISTKVDEDATVPVYIDKNDNFRLPDDNDAPIIMIGPGTGVAPFRAFVQHREHIGANGKNWLFFGDQHFTTDFLYQEEWLKYKKKGILHNLNVAFSRDQDEKVYVQHKMYEHSKELFSWLEDGAYIYICGDKNYMAKDVKRALFNIISKEGGFTDDLASEYFDKLKSAKRIREDVY